MPQQVLRKQPNSRMCLVCGLSNPAGLHTRFYELESEHVVGLFAPAEQHQGYPGRLHGGIICSVLDETIGRAIRIDHGDQIWGVTMALTTRFRRPAPLGRELRAVGRVTRQTRRHFEGDGRLFLPDGTVAAEAHGRYMKVPLENIADFDFQHEQWRVVVSDRDPLELEIDWPHSP